MPVIKKSPNLSQLISVGARNRNNLFKLRKSVRFKRSKSKYMYARECITSEDRAPDELEYGHNNFKSKKWSLNYFLMKYFSPLVPISKIADRVLGSPVVFVLRLLAIVATIIALVFASEINYSDHWDQLKLYSNAFVNYFFLMESIVKVVSFLEVILVEMELSDNMLITFGLRHSGIIDFALGKCCRSILK